MTTPDSEGDELRCHSSPGTRLVCWRPADDPNFLILPFVPGAEEPQLRFAMAGPEDAPPPPADEFSQMGKAWFSFKGDKVTPILPVAFRVVSTDAMPTPLPQGVTRCEYFKRVRGVGEYDGHTLIVHETVLKCDGAYYLLNGVFFQKD